MLRQTELYRVLGRYLTDKLIRAKWIIPIRNETGRVRFDKASVHRAVKRLRRSDGLALDGYAQRPIVTPAREGARPSDPWADLNLEPEFLEAELRRLER